jgi:succinate dehydrogenase/fumarate reductase flavoprotein subunit
MREVRTDVLVIGGGLAALRCALEARQAGVRVAVAVKGQLGRSGSSAMTSAGYSAVVASPDTSGLHASDTLAGGRALNDARLVELMTAEAPTRRDELLALGARLDIDDGGGWAVHPSGDHSIPRTVVAASFRGLEFTLPLAAAVRQAGCLILERTAALDVLLGDDGVAGAICMRHGDDAGLLAVHAAAVVLATGGCGQLFSVSSNPNDVTGDGYAIALRAGAALRDMEFIQFYPWRCIVPFDGGRMPIQPSTFVLGATLRNARGERFMEEATTRDVAARQIYDQIRGGGGVRGGVELDISALSDADWRRSNPRPAAWFDKREIDPRQTELIIAPEAHFFMGGVVIGEHGEATVPGLYTAGETAGGVHGANRLDSNAIPETQVFGARAGRAAAEHAATAPTPDHRPALLAWSRARGETLGATGDTPLDTYRVLRRRLQHNAWQNLGIVRRADHLRAGLIDVRETAATLHGMIPSLDALSAHVELENLTLVAAACFTSALAREESRGAHARADFPERDDTSWTRVLTVHGRGPEDLSLTDTPVAEVARHG